ncbi:vitamin k-dependent gamma-carboxylase [Holotrichia oblita]|nr:vitamin k-dependent gamma-carboxylase [Holotrichia oblita]
MFPRVYDQFTQWMYKETDPSSLAVVRFLFGVLMMVDIVEERGGSDLDIRWGEPRDCHFPLFTQLQPLPLTYMSLLYGVMWLGKSFSGYITGCPSGNFFRFSITGMFPYVCLATMPIFCEFDWPKRCMNKICRSKIDNRNNAGGNGNNATNTVPTTANDGSSNDPNRHRRRRRRIGFREKLVSGLILTYCGLQGFLPYSHFITKGYNNWTNGLYGYSWDMMIHSWDTVLVVVRVVDNLTGKEHFLDPSAWVQNNRWTKHADMTMQYAHCLKNNLLLELDDAKFLGDSKSISQYITSDNISIYVDVWCSLNGRLQQRMYDPNYDLLQAEWSVFEQAEWLLPLLSEYNDYRPTITGIQEHVYSWSNYTDVLFIADFPGLYLENYISQDLANVSLTILEGEVIYEDELKLGSVRLKKDGRKFVPTGIFHKVHTVSATPSCYIYTYLNKTRERLKEEDRPLDWEKATRSPFPLLEDRTHLAEGTGRMFGFIVNAILNVLYDVPMVRRTKVT